MKMWMNGDQRCCDRQTAVELGGAKYANKKIKWIYHFDEFIQIVDADCTASADVNDNEREC